MLNNWFKPIKLPAESTSWPSYQFGSQIIQFDSKNTSLETGNLVLVGIGNASNHIRKCLYNLTFPFQNLRIIDLGNFRKQSVDFMIPAMEELFKSKLIPILIGGELPLSVIAAYKGLDKTYRHVSINLIEQCLKPPTENQLNPEQYLSEILKDQKQYPYHLSSVGLQAHFTPPEVFRFLEQQHFEYVRLGKSKANIEELEPIIRDADVSFFNLDAIKSTYTPEQTYPSPSGFSLEESCTIARYAGLSDKLKAFVLFGCQNRILPGGVTAQSIAQIIWYFIDGFSNRKFDFPASMDGLTEYIVDLKSLDYQITFWRSSKSGRWWMQVPFVSKKAMKRHALISCSYNDYKKASNDQLPERLLQSLRRFS